MWTKNTAEKQSMHYSRKENRKQVTECKTALSSSHADKRDFIVQRHAVSGPCAKSRPLSISKRPFGWFWGNEQSRLQLPLSALHWHLWCLSDSLETHEEFSFAVKEDFKQIPVLLYRLILKCSLYLYCNIIEISYLIIIVSLFRKVVFFFYIHARWH